MRRLKKGITIWRRNTPAHLRTHSPPGAFYFQSKSQVLSHLLLAAVCGLRPLGSTAERSAVVTEVTGWVHLVLNESTHRRRPSNANPCRHEFAHGEGLKSWATWNLKFTLHYTGFTAACQLSLPPEFQTCPCWLYSRFSSVWRQDSCSSQLDTEKGWVNAEHLRGQIEPTSCMCRQILTDDGHERVEVSNVETLLSNIDEELYDPRSVFLLHRLKWENKQSRSVQIQYMYKIMHLWSVVRI